MKKRINHTTVHLREDAVLHFNPESQCIEIRNKNGEVSEKHIIGVGDAYHREKKNPKVIRMFGGLEKAVIPLQREVQIYERYIAIDTSYIKFGRNNLCSTAVIMTNQDLDHSKVYKRGEAIDLSSWPRLIFLAKPGLNPERYGWMRFISTLTDSEIYNPLWKYGVVVDSELDAIPSINHHEQSIINDFYLPENCSLIYCSADTGKENMLNKLIALADKDARITLEYAQKYLDLFKQIKTFDAVESYQDLFTLNQPIH